MSGAIDARSATSSRLRAREVASEAPAGPEGPVAIEAAEARPAQSNADERRQSTRRALRLDRSTALPQGSAGRGWVPPKWPYVLLAMTGSGVSGLAATGQWPAPAHGAVFLIAVLSAAGVGPAHRFAARGRIEARIAAACCTVVAPLFLFGLAMTLWSTSGGLPWDVLMASLICTTGITATYLRRQPGIILAALIACWAPAAIATGTAGGAATLLLALATAILVGREQGREQNLEDEYGRARERVQSRARDILADYEETGQGWFWETDRRAQLTYVSAPVAQAVGRDQGELIGQPLVELFDLSQGGEEDQRTLLFHLTARSAFQELTMRAATPGEERWWSVSGRPIYDEFDNFVGFRGSGTDLTAKRRSEEHATRLAHYDSLTGLANRFQMSQALDKILTSHLMKNRACAVILLDLDRFKEVNDSMGHPAGDALLRQVAQRLQRTVEQVGQIGRLGGDEFQVIVPGEMGRDRLGQLASQIIHALSQPYPIDGQTVVIGASVGIAVAPRDGTTGDELIRNADLALYAAKDLGRGRFHFYAQDLHAIAEARSRLEQDLREAIAHNHLRLSYQPVVSAATEKVSGFEALLRWQHPEQGWISPDRFVKMAEDTGLIVQIGEWALRTACAELARWPEEVRVAVNVSPIQFANPQLPAIVTSAVAQAGITPSRLELEITESVFVGDDERTQATFAALKRIGVRLALDDFGTGYSSLGYLQRAPFDKIKIDQSFVRGVTVPGSRNGAIITSITSLAQALGMETTAEGVETLDELDLIRSYGCTHIQGYIYSRPLTAEAATEHLQSGLAMVAQGPRSARAPRRTMLRHVVLEHGGQLYNGTIRNISGNGAMIEGPWNVPQGEVFQIRVSDTRTLMATTRWCDGDRMGVEFDTPLECDPSGAILALRGCAPKPVPALRPIFRKAG
jgi:diguanylate cyclase (GGDEF)-like protein/PAS domain S-box-containing protein